MGNSVNAKKLFVETPVLVALCQHYYYRIGLDTWWELCSGINQWQKLSAHPFTSFCSSFTNTAWKVSVFGVILVRIFWHLYWIRRDIPYLSVFSPNAGKYGYFLRRVSITLIRMRNINESFERMRNLFAKVFLVIFFKLTILNSLTTFALSLLTSTDDSLCHLYLIISKVKANRILKVKSCLIFS